MSSTEPILVTGAAGNVGGIGRTVVELLRERSLPVRALVHRLDERSDALKAMGAEVVVADLTNGADVVRVLNGCRRMYFGMGVSSSYMQATAIAAAAAREIPNFEILVNMSQMTISQMTLTNMTESKQQQQHWLCEQILNWSGVPVVHIRSTVFLEHFFFTAMPAISIAKDGTLRMPFGKAKTSPIAGRDVARVIVEVLEKPAGHTGKIYELTGPKSANLDEFAGEYEEALHRPVKYVDVPFEQWRTEELLPLGLPEHVLNHISTMAKLHADSRYDRLTSDVQKVTSTPSMSLREYVEGNLNLFAAAMKAGAARP